MNPELEKKACHYFACPNVNYIDNFVMDKNPSPDFIDKANELTMKLYRKTYHMPPFTSYKNATAACLYVASIITREKIDQHTIAEYFDISIVTLRKYYKIVVKELELVTNET